MCADKSAAAVDVDPNCRIRMPPRSAGLQKSLPKRVIELRIVLFTTKAIYD